VASNDGRARVPRDRIIEIAVVLLDAASPSTRRQPWHSTPRSFKTHGHRAVDAVAARCSAISPTSCSRARRLRLRCAQRALRLGVVSTESSGRRPAAPGPRVCTVRLARKLLPICRRNLDTVSYHFGIEIEGRHRATGDACSSECLGEMLKWLKGMGGVLGDLVGLADRR